MSNDINVAINQALDALVASGMKAGYPGCETWNEVCNKSLLADDPELRRRPADCLAKLFANPGLFRVCIDLCVRFPNAAQSPPSREDLMRFVNGLADREEFIALLKELGGDMLGSAAQSDASFDGVPATVSQPAEPVEHMVSLPDFPRFWALLGFVLPTKIRQKVFEPSLEEMKEDYLLARILCKTRPEACWLTFCFTSRTLLLIFQSVRAALGDRTLRILCRLWQWILRL